MDGDNCSAKGGGAMNDQEREERHRLQVMLAAGAISGEAEERAAVERIVALGRKEMDA
jgi:hypothetical protein